MNFRISLFLISLLLLSFAGQTQEKSTLMVEITGFRSDDGKVYVSLHNGPEGFPGGEGSVVDGKIGKIEDGKSFVQFEGIEPGEYALSVFHDENDNDELDTNWLGIPKEGTAASNNARGKMGPPKYEDAKFEVKGAGLKIQFEMYYMF